MDNMAGVQSGEKKSLTVWPEGVWGICERFTVPVTPIKGSDGENVGSEHPTVYNYKYFNPSASVPLVHNSE